jgi:hypothetical protein
VTRFIVALPLLASTLTACSGGFRFPLWPDTRTAVDRARELEARCTKGPERSGDVALTGAQVEAVEPDYTYVQSSNDRAIRLRGARLHLHPDGAPSAEALQRRLECHEALVTLGKAGELRADPFVLRDVWLDIHVESSGDGLVASVAVDKYDFDDARHVLDRAKTFAAAR